MFGHAKRTSVPEKRRQRTLNGGHALLAGAAALTCLIGGFASVPDLQNSRDDAARTRDAAAALNRQADAAEQVGVDPAYTSQLKEMRRAIPDAADTGSFTATLRAAAAAAGAVWISSTEEQEAAAATVLTTGVKVNAHRVDVRVEADEAALEQFVDEVESAPRLVRLAAVHRDTPTTATLTWTTFSLAADTGDPR